MLISFGVFRFLSMANENVQQISMHVSNLKHVEESDPLTGLAFGLGYEPVDPSIGTFSLKIQNTTKVNTDQYTEE